MKKTKAAGQTLKTPAKAGKAAGSIPKAVMKEIEDLKNRLQEAEDTLGAIRSGAVDALVVSAPGGDQVFTLRGAEHPYRVFFETMNEGGAVISTEGTILACNRGFGRMVGVSMEKLCGGSFYDFIAPPQRSRTRGLFNRVCKSGAGGASRQALRGETVLQFGKGVRVPVQLALSAIYESGTTTICVVVTDLTAQKRVEEILQRSQAELEGKVSERTAEIRALNEQLNRQVKKLHDFNKELDTFVYSVSHDLRAPLRTISGFIKMLAEDYAERLDAEGRDWLDRVYNGSKKMGRLIEDLLFLSNISRQGLDRRNVDLSREAASIVEGMRAADPGRRVEISIAEGMTAYADEGLISIVLTNLLENAWKFTSKTENARIEFGVNPPLRTDPPLRPSQEGTSGECPPSPNFGPNFGLNRGREETVYYVWDNGAGFNPDHKEKMFAPFQRLHSEEEFEGTGIGLSIVERIIRRHGGRVWAEGEPGKGAAFFFTLG